jgi:hypothetical protein
MGNSVPLLRDVIPDRTVIAAFGVMQDIQLQPALSSNDWYNFQPLGRCIKSGYGHPKS